MLWTARALLMMSILAPHMSLCDHRQGCILLLPSIAYVQDQSIGVRTRSIP